MTHPPNYCDIDSESTDGERKEAIANAEILDYDALINRCMGNLDFVNRVLTKFHERLPIDFREMEQAVARQDTQLVASVAHRIKGSVANISAKSLHIIAQEIEDMGRAGCLDDIPARIEAFRKEWERLCIWTSSVLPKTTSRQV
jgi:HPt (histidine-containing phosphotransfer) domain-containing protein